MSPRSGSAAGTTACRLGRSRSELPLRRPLADPLVELLAERLGAFAQPLRIKLVDCLDARGEATVQELADALQAGQQNVSKHLGLLRRLGVVARRKDGIYVRYRLVDPDALPLLEQAAIGIARQLHDKSLLIAPERELPPE